jgi:cytochrome P450
MSDEPRGDWDPTSAAVQRDQRAAYDAMRERCPVAYSELLGWSLFRHADVMRALHDPQVFSNAVSAHPAVPNGMDPPQHTAYRRIIEPYFAADRMAAFEPPCRDIAVRLLQPLLGAGEVELVGAFSDRYAVQVQCTFLGWPPEMHEPMRAWTQKNYAARLADDRAQAARLAAEFERHVVAMLDARRAGAARAGDDVTARLLREQVSGRALNDKEIVSILRTWTVGEISTISAAVGILAQYLAEHADLQHRLRAAPSLLPAAIEEILRLHGPLVANRRRTTRAVEIDGRPIAAGERISLNWIAANRDGRVFADPQTCRLEREQSANLLWGAGVHVCPGAPLARMELRIALEELLARTTRIEPLPDKPPTAAVYPASGFASVFLRLG